MNDYQKEAKSFLIRNNVSLKITKAKKTIDEICDNSKGMFEGETSKHNKYRFTITTSKGSYWSIFWDSINATEQGTTPDDYDILACLSVDYSEDFSDFCANYGYEENVENDRGYMVRNSSAYKTFIAIQKQSDSLERIFSEKQIDELYEIA